MILEGAYWLVQGFNAFVLGFFVASNTLYTGLFFLSSLDVWRHLKTLGAGGIQDIFQYHLAPSISLLVPAYNEEASVVDSVASLLNLTYHDYEVVVINDGSRDQTLARLKEAFDLRPVNLVAGGNLPCQPIRGIYISRKQTVGRLIVVDKENGGKADALNAGINLARSPLFCAIDADAILEQDALLRTVKPFLDRPETVAVGGIVRLANGSIFKHGLPVKIQLPKESIARFQVVEYLRAFLFGRAGWSCLNALLIISGAFGLFRRDTVLAVGGYKRNTVGEDMDLVVRLHRHCRAHRIPYRISFVSDPVCWTEAPSNYVDLAKQRNRWQRGLLEVLWTYRHMCFNPRYGLIGMVSYPAFVLIEGLGPLIEGTGYLTFALSLLMGWIDVNFALMFLAMSVVFGIFLSTGAVLLEEMTYRRYPSWRDWLILLGYGILENFGYRQRHVFWRIQGTWDRLRGKTAWGQLKRTGFTNPRA